MLILIAESKSMSPYQEAITEDELERHRPVFGKTADEICSLLATMPPAELAERLKLGPKSTQQCMKLSREFGNKSEGYRAIRAFTGTVFRALDYATLTADEQENISRDVAIISSLYGWLEPDDIVKPYRLDYKAHIANVTSSSADSNFFLGDDTMQKYWLKPITVALIKHLKERSENEILSLLPADAHGCFDWKLIKRFARVGIADFRTIGDGTLLERIAGRQKVNLRANRAPGSERLKQLRGRLLRKLAGMERPTLADLARVRSDDWLYAGEPVNYPGHYVLITD